MSLKRTCTNCGVEIIAERFRVPEKRTRCRPCRNRAIARNRKLADRMRERNPNWGGGLMRSNGYIYILKPDHPKARKDGYVKRANLVWEEATGHYPGKKEIIHHKDGNAGNDSLENLKLMTLSGHSSFHSKGKNNPRYKHGKYMSQKGRKGETVNQSTSKEASAIRCNKR